MTLTAALLGCGVMGRRHVLGLKALQETGRSRVRLVAVIDPIAEAANRVADLAGELLGERPAVFADLAEMQARQTPDYLTVVTAPGTHADLTIAAMNGGSHVLAEKPIALTTQQGARMVAHAATTGRILSIAENYRRDPINRLARALVGAGEIGRPTLAIQSSSAWGEKVIITPWRHRKLGCGIAVDMGVHYTDILEYLLGPITSVVGMNAIVDAERIDDAGVRHPVDAEDLSVGVARFANGALANLLMNLAGRGESLFQRVLYGTGGSLSIPMDRTGHPLKLVQRRNGADVEVPQEELLGLVPGFQLDPTTAALFGGERLTSYDRTFAQIDAGLLAIEHDDICEAIITGNPPEVTGEQGLRSLALMYGFIESELTGRILSADELLTSAELPYQAGIDATSAAGR